MCSLPGRVQRVAAQGQASLPGQLVIVTDKGKTSKEQGNLVVKEAMCAMLQAWDAPFRCVVLPTDMHSTLTVRALSRSRATWRSRRPCAPCCRPMTRPSGAPCMCA